jgi:hypothetical protein
MGRAISICGLVPYPVDTTPSQRYRIEQWVPYLEQEGISVDLVPFVDDRLMKILYQPGRWLAKAAALTRALVRCAGRLQRTRQYDVVLVHRAISIAGPAVFERVVAASGARSFSTSTTRSTGCTRRPPTAGSAG